MKEDKDAEMYRRFIQLVIQHVSAVDTSVRLVTVDDIWQTIQDHNCSYVKGEDKEDSDVEDVFGPKDVEKTFKEGELTTTVRDEIARCFEEMSEAHKAMKDAHKSASKLVPKLSSRGMGVLLKALVMGMPATQDPALISSLQDSRAHQRL